ncbi:MAG: L-seryl-tRNA(Sec) selenium transferase [Candidatus Riflebacteria bacterium]|nr:L-seryl-tRNA(Sec) selenium transferase [Candidatus Riflebacteria bacterium]
MGSKTLDKKSGPALSGEKLASLYRALPSVERLLSGPRLATLETRIRRDLVVRSTREVLAAQRARIAAGTASTVPSPEELTQCVIDRLQLLSGGGLTPVINATGTILHTNLGRAKVASEVAEVAGRVAASYVDLEIDLATGRRGDRYKGVGRMLTALTGAEGSLAVNNNAAAVLLAVNTLASGRQVVVSRGELVEIGGAFRVPEIVKAAGATLVEVGTTNRTRVSDYERAIGPDTGLLLKTHTSNYRIVGFSKSPSTRELVQAGNRHGIPVYEDLGSGCLVDLSRYGLSREPTISEVVAAGVDVVSFSTDKLLGGPQGGILAGKSGLIRAMRANHLLRALRIDKVTMAMLEKTLAIYLDPASIEERIPFYWALARGADQVRREAEAFVAALSVSRLVLSVEPGQSRIGGGACPVDRLATSVVALTHREVAAEALALALRRSRPPVLGRIHRERVLLDFRTVFPEDREPLAQVLRRIDRDAAAA